MPSSQTSVEGGRGDGFLAGAWLRVTIVGRCPSYKFLRVPQTFRPLAQWERNRALGLYGVVVGRAVWNFIKDKPGTPSATRDAIIQWMDSLTDANRADVTEHWKELQRQNEANAASPGRPEEALPSPADRNPLWPSGDGTAFGRPQIPPPVDQKSLLRPTGQNPSKNNRVIQTDNTTTEENRPGVVVVGDAASRSAIDVKSGRMHLLKVFVELEKEAPNLTTAQERQIDELIDRDGVELPKRFCAAIWRITPMLR